MGIECNSNEEMQLGGLVQMSEPAEINQRMATGDSFVVNVVAAWCPDCTQRQTLYIDGFAEKMQQHGIEVLQVNVQVQKGDFISAEHEKITNQFGGHGYPRTVLINQGKVVDKDNVEIITEDGLAALSRKFMQIIAKA